MPVTLSLHEARRLAIASQGFAARPRDPSAPQLRKLAARLRAFQIGSVNVLVRAHYVPAFARLGPSRMKTLDSLACLKTGRDRKVLLVQSAFLEPGQEARRVAPELIAELQHLREWLELDRIQVAERGDLARQLRANVRRATAPPKPPRPSNTGG
jgi:uncharacterized protein YcaQ